MKNILASSLKSYIITLIYFFLPTKSWKNHPQKLLRKTQIHFFPLLPWAAQTAQTEKFMFQNVAYRPAVYRTGLTSKNRMMIRVHVIHKLVYLSNYSFLCILTFLHTHSILYAWSKISLTWILGLIQWSLIELYN